LEVRSWKLEDFLKLKFVSGLVAQSFAMFFTKFHDVFLFQGSSFRFEFDFWICSWFLEFGFWLWI